MWIVNSNSHLTECSHFTWQLYFGTNGECLFLINLSYLYRKQLKLVIKRSNSIHETITEQALPFYEVFIVQGRLWGNQTWVKYDDRFSYAYNLRGKAGVWITINITRQKEMCQTECIKTSEGGMINFDRKSLYRILWTEKGGGVFQAQGRVNMSESLEEWIVIVHVWEVANGPVSIAQNVQRNEMELMLKNVG